MRGVWLLVAALPLAVAQAGGVDPQCAGRNHDGGDGVCIALSKCSAGFELDATGHCARWAVTATLDVGRRGHTLTTLGDGRVVAIGGEAGDQAHVAVYDPVAATWTALAAGGAPRTGHTATRLPDGRVLVAGGVGPGGADPSPWALELDPRTLQWTAVDVAWRAREGHTATLLPDGAVLIAGGLVDDAPTADAIRYDPASRSFVTLTSMGTPRAHHATALRSDGQVVVTGGVGPGGQPVASVESYSPATGQWSPAAPLEVPRAWHVAIPMDKTRVLVAGGLGVDTVHRTSELYTPRRNAWDEGPSMRDPRWGFVAVELLDGRWLLAGGGRTPVGRAVVGVEVFDGANIIPVDDMGEPRLLPAAALLTDGSVLVAGGLGAGESLSSTNHLITSELYQVGW